MISYYRPMVMRLALIGLSLLLSSEALADNQKEGSRCTKNSDCAPSRLPGHEHRCTKNKCTMYFEAELVPICTAHGDVRSCALGPDKAVLLPNNPGERTASLPCSSDEQCGALAVKIGKLTPESYFCEKTIPVVEKSLAKGGPWCFTNTTKPPRVVAATGNNDADYAAFIQKIWKIYDTVRIPELVEKDLVTADLEQLRSDPASTSKTGKYTLSPAARKLTAADFEKFARDGKFKLVTEADLGRDDRIFTIARKLYTKYGSDYYIPGVELWKWIIENPSKVPEVVRKQKGELVFFGSVMSGAGGEWQFPAVKFYSPTKAIGRFNNSFDYDSRAIVIKK